MGIPGGANLLLAAGGVSAYEIDQSLRFDGSSYLQRTFSNTGSRTAWTYSVWVKVADTAPTQHMNLSICSATDRNYHDNFYIAQNSSEISWSGSPAGGLPYNFASNDKYRDPSAWYHYLFVYDSANATAVDRVRVYTNGSRPSKRSGTNPSQNYQSEGIGRANRRWRIGWDEYPSTSWYHRGYMAEVNFVDGSALEPTSFGEYDDNGVWRPIAYSGSYGGNGFYLKFDPSATNGIGHDHSGNGNHFTATGFSTSTTTYNINNDVVKDTPTNNHATWLPGKSKNFMPGPTQAYAGYRNNGNLYGNTGRNSPQSIFSSIPFPDNAKTYVEVYINDVGGGGGSLSPAVAVGCDYNGFGPYIYGSSNDQQDTAAYFSGYNGAFSWNGGSGTSNGGGFGSGTLIGVAVDTTTTSPTITFYKNGTQAGTGTVGSAYRKNLVVRIESATGSSTAVGAYLNAGQYDFDNLPSGYSALCTANIPAPDIADGSDNFQVLLYTGNATARSITVEDNSANAWQPDLTWIKCRSVGTDNVLTDAVRGATKVVRSNITNTEYTQSDSLTAFTSTGFNLGDDNDGGVSGNFNVNGRTYVAWNWLAGNGTSSNSSGSITSTVSANPSAGFSVVTYTGNSSNGATFGHGLGVAPGFVTIKCLDQSYGWALQHQSLAANEYLFLNGTFAKSSGNNFWNNTRPSSTVITLGTDGTVNQTGQDYVAYCFAEVEGYSKIGSYVANNNLDGPFVYCGFSPAFVLVKSVSAYNWLIYDNQRLGYNVTEKALFADEQYTEQSVGSAGYGIDFVSNGFKLRSSSNPNQSSHTYVYIAFAENPFGGDGVSPATAR